MPCTYSILNPVLIKNKHLLDWNSLSNNEKLPWTLEFIEKFKDFWNWDSLSGNESLPWSDEIIEKFDNKWEWDYINDPYESCLT